MFARGRLTPNSVRAPANRAVLLRLRRGNAFAIGLRFNPSPRQETNVKPLSHTLLAVLMIAAACGGDITTGSIGGKADDFSTFEEFLASLYCEPDSDVCIVGGDVPLATEDDARDYYQQMKAGLALSVHTVDGIDALWDNQLRHNLTYCIDDSLGDRRLEVETALTEAIGDWQEVAHVTFTHRADQDGRCGPSNQSVVFDVGLAPPGAPFIARAFFPSTEREARNLRINLDSMDDIATDPEIGDILTLRGVLRHELGHVLGFRHEHTRPESGATFCFEDDNFRPITAYDAKSTMHYPQCNGEGNWSLALTENDGVGAKFFYPNLDDYEGGRCDKEILASGNVARSCEPVVREILELANKAPAEVLSDSVGLNLEAIAEITAERGSLPFNKIGDLLDLAAVTEGQVRKMYDYLYVFGRCDLEVDQFSRLNIECRPVVHRVLEFVNAASLEEIDVAAGLDKRAAGNIVAIRQHTPFSSIADLYAVSFVKTRAILKLYLFLYPH